MAEENLEKLLRHVKQAGSGLAVRASLAVAGAKLKANTSLDQAAVLASLRTARNNMNQFETRAETLYDTVNNIIYPMTGIVRDLDTLTFFTDANDNVIHIVPEETINVIVPATTDTVNLKINQTKQARYGLTVALSGFLSGQKTIRLWREGLVYHTFVLDYTELFKVFAVNKDGSVIHLGYNTTQAELLSLTDAGLGISSTTVTTGFESTAPAIGTITKNLEMQNKFHKKNKRVLHGSIGVTSANYALPSNSGSDTYLFTSGRTFNMDKKFFTIQKRSGSELLISNSYTTLSTKSSITDVLHFEDRSVAMSLLIGADTSEMIFTMTPLTTSEALGTSVNTTLPYISGFTAGRTRCLWVHDEVTNVFGVAAFSGSTLNVGLFKYNVASATVSLLKTSSFQDVDLNFYGGTNVGIQAVTLVTISDTKLIFPFKSKKVVVVDSNQDIFLTDILKDGEVISDSLVSYKAYRGHNVENQPWVYLGVNNVPYKVSFVANKAVVTSLGDDVFLANKRIYRLSTGKILAFNQAVNNQLSYVDGSFLNNAPTTYSAISIFEAEGTAYLITQNLSTGSTSFQFLRINSDNSLTASLAIGGGGISSGAVTTVRFKSGSMRFFTAFNREGTGLNSYFSSYELTLSDKNQQWHEITVV